MSEEGLKEGYKLLNVHKEQLNKCEKQLNKSEKQLNKEELNKSILVALVHD